MMKYLRIAYFLVIAFILVFALQGIGPGRRVGPGGPGISAEVGPAADDSAGIPPSGTPTGPGEFEWFYLEYDANITAARQYLNHLLATGTDDGTGQYQATYPEWALHDILELDIELLCDSTAGRGRYFVDSVRQYNPDIVIAMHDLAFLVLADTSYQGETYPYWAEKYKRFYPDHLNWIALNDVGDTAAIHCCDGEGYFYNPLNDSCRTEYVKWLRDILTDTVFCTNLRAGTGVEFDVYNYNSTHASRILNDLDLDQNTIPLVEDTLEQLALRDARIAFLQEFRDTMTLYQDNFLIGINTTSGFRDSALLREVDLLQIEGFHHWTNPFVETNKQCFFGANPYHDIFDPNFRDVCEGTWLCSFDSVENINQNPDDWVDVMRRGKMERLGVIFQNPLYGRDVGTWLLWDTDSIPAKGEILAKLYDYHDQTYGRSAHIYTRDYRYSAGYGPIQDVNSWCRWWYWGRDGLDSLGAIGYGTTPITRNSADTRVKRIYSNGSIDLFLPSDFDDTLRSFDYYVTQGTQNRVIYRQDTLRAVITKNSAYTSADDSFYFNTYGTPGPYMTILSDTVHNKRGWYGDAAADSEKVSYKWDVDRVQLHPTLFHHANGVEVPLMYFGVDSLKNFIGSDVIQADLWLVQQGTSTIGADDYIYFLGMNRGDLNWPAGGDTSCNLKYLNRGDSTPWPSRGGGETYISQYSGFSDVSTLSPSDTFTNFNFAANDTGDPSVMVTDTIIVSMESFYDAIASGDTNCGIIVLGEGTGETVPFRSFRDDDAGDRPRLYLTYVTAYLDTLRGLDIVRTNDSIAPVIAVVPDTTGEGIQHAYCNSNEYVRWRFRSKVGLGSWSSWTDTTEWYYNQQVKEFYDPRSSGERWYVEVQAFDQAGYDTTVLDSIGDNLFEPPGALKAPVMADLPDYNRGDTLTVSWDAVVYADSYMVWVDRDYNFNVDPDSSGWGDSTYVLFDNLSQLNTKYYYRVRGADALMGDSPWSNIDSTTQDGINPDAVWVDEIDTLILALTLYAPLSVTTADEPEGFKFRMHHRLSGTSWADTAYWDYADTQSNSYNTTESAPSTGSYEGQQRWYWRRPSTGYYDKFIFHVRSIQHGRTPSNWTWNQIAILDTNNCVECKTYTPTGDKLPDSTFVFNQVRGLVIGRVMAINSAEEDTFTAMSDSQYHIVSDSLYFWAYLEDTVGNTYSDSSIWSIYTVVDITAPDTSSEGGNFVAYMDTGDYAYGSSEEVYIWMQADLSEKALGQFWWKNSWDGDWLSPDSLWWYANADSTPSTSFSYYLNTDSSTAELDGDSIFVAFKLKDDDYNENMSTLRSSRSDTHYVQVFERYDAGSDVTAPTISSAWIAQIGDSTGSNYHLHIKANTNEPAYIWANYAISGGSWVFFPDDSSAGHGYVPDSSGTGSFITSPSDSFMLPTSSYGDERVTFHFQVRDQAENESAVIDSTDFSALSVWLARKPYSPAGGYYSPIVIDSTEVENGADLTNFVFTYIDSIPTRLAIATRGGHVADSLGYDIFWATSVSPGAGDTLKSEVEYYNPYTGKIIAHILIPTLSDDVNTTIYMHYGDDQFETARHDTAEVWTDFKFVTHMQYSGNQVNVTGNNPTTSTANGSPSQRWGLLGYGVDFDQSGLPSVGERIYWASDSMLDLGNGDGDYTMSIWVKRDTMITACFNMIMGGSKQAAYGWHISFDDQCATALQSPVYYQHRGSPYPNVSTAGNTSLDLHHIVTRWDDTANDMWLYVDGVQADYEPSGANPGVPSGNPGLIHMGADFSSATVDNFDGYIGEVRIVNTLRTAAWCITEYNNLGTLDDSTSPHDCDFWSVGSEVAK